MFSFQNVKPFLETEIILAVIFLFSLYSDIIHNIISSQTDASYANETWYHSAPPPPIWHLVPAGALNISSQAGRRMTGLTASHLVLMSLLQQDQEAELPDTSLLNF